MGLGQIAWLTSACMRFACLAHVQGVVDRLVDKYVGEIEMSDSGDVIRVDSAQLETVIPQVSFMKEGRRDGEEALE